MSPNRWKLVGLWAMVFGITVSCGGGGSSSGAGSPFPPAVTGLFGPLGDALRDGAAWLPLSITCGPILNPFEEDVDTKTVPIATSGADHAGTVATVEEQTFEKRNPDGSGTITYTVRDSGAPTRVYIDMTRTFGAPTIQFLPPPLGANEFLATDGTGPVFVVLTIERRSTWTRTFAFDPGVTGDTLVNFAGSVVIPSEPDGTIAGDSYEKISFIVEFDVFAGATGNDACIVGIVPLGQVETNFRNGSIVSVSALEHVHDAFADTALGPTDALRNSYATVLPVGNDALAPNAVLDGDTCNLGNGSLVDGIANYPPSLNESNVDVAAAFITNVDDGVGNPTDGRFDGVSTYDVSGDLNAAGVPAVTGNGTVEVSVWQLNTFQLEDPRFGDLDHPVLTEATLYGAIIADTWTGLVIFW